MSILCDNVCAISLATDSIGRSEQNESTCGFIEFVMSILYTLLIKKLY